MHDLLAPSNSTSTATITPNTKHRWYEQLQKSSVAESSFQLTTMRLCFILYVLIFSNGCLQSKKETSKSMPNPGTYFEIPVTDFERAVVFYEAVFLCELQIKNIDGNQMAVFPGSPGSPGIIGALAMGSSYKPSMDGSRIYLHTDNIDETLQLVVANGGRIEYPKTSIGELGWVAEFIDTEGNRIALHSL